MLFLNRLKRRIVTRWKADDYGWFTLNTDDAVSWNKQDGCGGVLRTETGDWVGGFSKNIGSCSPYIVELWGVKEGIIMVNERNINKIEIQVDNINILKDIQNCNNKIRYGTSLLLKIQDLLKSIP